MDELYNIWANDRVIFKNAHIDEVMDIVFDALIMHYSVRILWRGMEIMSVTRNGIPLLGLMIARAYETSISEESRRMEFTDKIE